MINLDVNILAVAYFGFSDSDGKATLSNLGEAYQNTIIKFLFDMNNYPEINEKINLRYIFLYADNIGTSVALGIEKRI